MFEKDIVVALGGIGFFVGHTIQIDYAVSDFKSLARQSDAAFHIVLTAINRTGHNLAEYLFVL